MKIWSKQLLYVKSVPPGPYLMASRSVRLLAAPGTSLLWPSTPQVLGNTLSGQTVGQNPFEFSFSVHSSSIGAGTVYLLDMPGLLDVKAEDGTLVFSFGWKSGWYAVPASVLAGGWNEVTLTGDGLAEIKLTVNTSQFTIYSTSTSAEPYPAITTGQLDVKNNWLKIKNVNAILVGVTPDPDPEPGPGPGPDTPKTPYVWVDSSGNEVWTPGGTVQVDDKVYDSRYCTSAVGTVYIATNASTFVAIVGENHITYNRKINDTGIIFENVTNRTVLFGNGTLCFCNISGIQKGAKLNSKFYELYANETLTTPFTNYVYNENNGQYYFPVEDVCRYYIGVQANTYGLNSYKNYKERGLLAVPVYEMPDGSTIYYSALDETNFYMATVANVAFNNYTDMKPNSNSLPSDCIKYQIAVPPYNSKNDYRKQIWVNIDGITTCCRIRYWALLSDISN